MVEYVLLVTAVIVVCIYFFAAKTGPMHKGLNATLNSVVNQINNLNGQIQFSGDDGGPGGGGGGGGHGGGGGGGGPQTN